MPTQRQIYKIRIINSDGIHYWYNNKIGMEFFVVKEMAFRRYRVISNPDYDRHHISLLDAEVI